VVAQRSTTPHPSLSKEGNYAAGWRRTQFCDSPTCFAHERQGFAVRQPANGRQPFYSSVSQLISSREEAKCKVSDHADCAGGT